jgi:Papain family cysteine protease
MSATRLDPASASCFSFMGELRKGISLDPAEQEVMRVAGVRSSEHLQALLWNFPSLSKIIDFPKLSNAAVRLGGATLVQSVMSSGFSPGQPPMLAFGANHPPGGAAPVGFQVPLLPMPMMAQLVPSPPAAAGPLVSSPPYDFRRAGWPVRDQGARGTCVAFASTAVSEFEHSGAGNVLELSEQFLYWSIKTNSHDPIKAQDGTWLEYARESLALDGICEEANWPYVPQFNSLNIRQVQPGEPTAAAVSDAATRRFQPSVYQTSGGAAALLNAFASRQRPLAISLPVFGDAFNPQAHNWNSALGFLYGLVLDPPPTSVVLGGHAVCISGFQPDPGEPLGGWFIIRNSWGTTVWGKALPATGYFGPEAGYGQVSATYVDKYLWELCAF